MKLCLSLAVGCLVATNPALAVTNLAANPGFENGGLGWGAFGAASFNAFFGGNGHASLFPDTFGNNGGVFQLGIPAQEGRTYQFDLLDTRIEANYDAVTQFGLEFYAADDATKLGESFVTIDAAERFILPNVGADGGVNAAVFSARGTAPVGATIVRPVVKYADVNPTYFPGETPVGRQTNLFVFNSYLSEVPAPGGNLLKNPVFDDENGDTAAGDVWGRFGNTGFGDFFNNGNFGGALFADTAGQSGGLFQQSILADAGVTYEFELTDVRIESSFDARLRFGLEYYGSDDFTLLGSDIATVDTSVTGDGLSFRTTGTPVAGTVYVRPVVLFDGVNPLFAGQAQANAFVFDTVLREAVALPGDYNGDGSVNAADYTVWRDGNSPDDTRAGYTLWASNYGAPVAPSAAAAVPEPSALLLAAAAGWWGASRRRD